MCAAIGLVDAGPFTWLCQLREHLIVPCLTYPARDLLKSSASMLCGMKSRRCRNAVSNLPSLHNFREDICTPFQPAAFHSQVSLVKDTCAS